jgi:ABC-type branched-subunit amino acid transport system ATPase component
MAGSVTGGRGRGKTIGLRALTGLPSAGSGRLIFSGAQTIGILTTTLLDEVLPATERARRSLLISGFVTAGREAAAEELDLAVAGCAG